MATRRCLSVWFPYLLTDWLTAKQPTRRDIPFVVVAAVHGRQVIQAANPLAVQLGVHPEMVLADAKAFVPALEAVEEKPRWKERLLKSIAVWSIRFAPVVAVDKTDTGLLLDVSGCAHLWGGEEAYLSYIQQSFQQKGYHIKLGLADTYGAAWGVARFASAFRIIPVGKHVDALQAMSASALRLSQPILDRLYKLGLRTIGQFAFMQRSVLRRRFGEELLLRLAQTFGQEKEWIEPVVAPIPYEERLACLEPVNTAPGIEIAITKLLESLCMRLDNEGKGLRRALLKAYRVDGKVEQIGVQTSRPSANVAHLFKLFALKISDIEPALGIELFVLSAFRIEDLSAAQEALWSQRTGLTDPGVAELIDRLKNKSKRCEVSRFLPDTHYWPERAIRLSDSLVERSSLTWTTNRPRPARLLPQAIPIAVTAPIPDYPPMLFTYLGVVHKICKSDGPERIEREWWMEEGDHRDYYQVEDQQGSRYWIYRSGHYNGDKPAKWFLHGFFA